MSQCLMVYWDEHLVGELKLDAQRRFVFRYASSWLASDRAQPISLSLPLCDAVFDDDCARPFFSNLLPESELRQQITRKLGLSEKNDFALLEAIGGECAGAISLLPEGESLPKESGAYHELTDNQLNQLIQAIPTRPLLAGEAGIRLSLAGAQNKLPIRYRNGQVSLPYGRAASTHIIKPAITHYESSVMNEWFCMRLAKLMDLPVPDVLIIGTETPVYCVERYDRIIVTDEHVERLHQEDFCQALGVAADVKYEKEGGPSLRDCFGLIRSASIQPAKDLNTALKWVVFNYLIGNADAHAKNIALLLTQQGPRLAPFYDLMCTAIYEGLSDRLAMKIGNEDRPDWVIERRWNDMANDLEIDYKLVRRLLAAMSHKITNVAAQLQDHCSSRYGSRDTIVQINKVIAQRVTKVMRILEISE